VDILPISQICMINQMVVIWTAYLIISEVKTMPGPPTANGYMENQRICSITIEKFSRHPGRQSRRRI